MNYTRKESTELRQLPKGMVTGDWLLAAIDVYYCWELPRAKTAAGRNSNERAQLAIGYPGLIKPKPGPSIGSRQLYELKYDGRRAGGLTRPLKSPPAKQGLPFSLSGLVAIS